ncbi:type IV secretory system conjugative DNA transfer family protein [Streptomyces lunaelactis]|uniref:type IV secretory system conjugative DNA transfer family protein n=1 Tax=Streptomyces lunaelactis TaxID=1535768 RepID=UPI0015847ACE|nr:type IV secretory system conjugative DNA transfer family protein [Streptomyces lunaelactis]NUL28412.1 type IV secretory system conjugative DNA transfer family protein [Streptomyces lunaelactis]
MMLAVLLASGGLAILGLILGARWLDALAWRRRLVAYQLRLPTGLTAEQVSGWLTSVAADSHHWPVGIEIEASRQGIAFYLLVSSSHETSTLARLRSALPGVRADLEPDYLAARPAVRTAREFKLTSSQRPLAADRAQSAVTSLLSGLHSFAHGESVRVQWLLSGGRVFLPGKEDAGELARAVRAKNAAPVFNAVARVAVTAPSRARAVNLSVRVTNALKVLDAPGVSVLPRLLPLSTVTTRLYNRAVPLTVWPMRLNTHEVAGLLGFPLGNLHLPGLELGRARQLPPPQDMARSGLVLAASNFPGAQDRPLALRTSDRLRHLHLIGPTGVGKSTLIANAALQDIGHGDGLLLMDPKSDLVAEVLARVPDPRTKDVIVLDPSATDFPIGFNVLQVGRSEHERELVVDHVVHVFSELWRSSWGPRTSDVLRTCLLTLTHTRAHDGSAFALTEVPELLLNPAFRKFVTAQTSVPDSVRSFWAAYEHMSEGERAQVIGPSMNKLRSLTTRTSLRLMLGQSKGIDLADVFTKRSVVLVALSKGTVGTETAHLLGSLLMAALWQTTLARAAVPAEKRRPAWAYLDEFQDVLRLGTDGELADMLAQARGLGLGLTLAHQYLDQLPRQVQAAVLGTARSQVAFQLDHDDARALEKRFAPALTAADLTGLPAYEIAVRPSINGQTRPPTTGLTYPLSEPTHDPAVLAEQSRQRYGTPRADVEAALRSRIETPASARIGRSKRGGSS